MNQPTAEEIQVQEIVKQHIEDAIEKKRITKEILAVDKELNNIFLFRDILGIRYIPAVQLINNVEIEE